MKRVTVKKAQGILEELIEEVSQGEVVLIEGCDESVELRAMESQARKFGTAEGLIKVHDDFEEPLEDFANYE